MKPETFEKEFGDVLLTLGDASFSLRLSGYFVKKHDLADPYMHLHSGVEIQCIQEGAITIITDSGEYAANAGDIVVIPSGVYHHSGVEKGGVCRFACEVAILPNDNDTSFYEYLMYNRILSMLNRVVVFRSDEVFETLNKFTRLENLNSSEQFNKIQSLLSIFLIDVFAELKLHIPNCDTEKTLTNIKKNALATERQRYIIANCISENYNSEMVADKIEKALNMSKRNTARIVYGLFGKTVSELVLEHRMKTSAIWIKNSNLPLGEIAEKIGYMTYVAFFTAFKKYYGISPKEYRENIK